MPFIAISAENIRTSRRQFERTMEILASKGVSVYPLPPPRKVRKKKIVVQNV